MTRNNWRIVERNDGIPTMWKRAINNTEYDKYVYVCDLSTEYECLFNVEVICKLTDKPVSLKTCKTAAAAKRWATMNLNVEVECSGDIAEENASLELDIKTDFEKLLLDYEIADNNVARSRILESMYNYLLNCTCQIDPSNLIHFYDMFKMLHSNYHIFVNRIFDKELLEKAERHIVDLRYHIQYLDQLVDLTEILNTKLLLESTLTNLYIKECDETTYSILLGRRAKILEFIYSHLSDFDHYGYLKRLLNKVLTIPINVNILTRINEAYLENDGFDKNNAKQPTNIDILMQDGCTKSEAIKHLNRGTVVFDTVEFYSFLKEEGIEYDDIADECGFVNVNDTEYVIMYVL